MVVSINGCTPIAGWFISWQIPIYKWMMQKGYPHFRKPPYEEWDTPPMIQMGLSKNDGFSSALRQIVWY